MLDGLELGKKMGYALQLNDSTVALREDAILRDLAHSMREYEKAMWKRMDEEKTQNSMSQGLLFAEE